MEILESCQKSQNVNETRDKYEKIKVNDVFESNFGGTFTVIKVINQELITVAFNDDFKYETVTTSWAIKRGGVKNPFAKRLFNLGYFGVGRFKACHGSKSSGAKSTPEYAAWVNMLSRCYYEKGINVIKGYSTYTDVTVDKSWFNFQVFAEWYTKESNRIHRIDSTLKLNLDKDIISPELRVYSENTCCLIPSDLNTAIIVKQNVKNNKMPSNFVKRSNGKYHVTFTAMNDSVKLADFNTELECVTAFITAKEQYIKFLANKYISILSENVYHTLINYKHPKSDALLLAYSHEINVS